MTPMDEVPLPAPPSIDDRCFRHPDQITGVHCTRCGKPICTDCMTPAPIGHQCPDCVKGAKQEFRSPAPRVAAGPAAGFTLTKVILGILAVVYAVEVAAAGPASLIAGPSALDLIRLGAGIGATYVPGDGTVGIAFDQQWRLLTAMFLHGGLLHLAMNGYVLYIFGSIVEQEMGRLRFLAIYLVTGLSASVASYAFGPFNTAGVGASGAIFGLVGAFLAYNWSRRDVAFHAARVRSAMTFVLINAVISFSIPAIDWRAHFGGLAAGVVAGFAAEGFGRTISKRAVFIAGLTCLLVLCAALTIWRTQELRQLLGISG